jgi:hypothetical protein
MSVLTKLASALERNDEVPNQILAKELVETENRAGVRELVENLTNKDKTIAADCIKVLYEVGYAKPELIAPYVEAFVKLLASRNNRLVWGGMTALGAIAPTQPAELWKYIDTIIDATEHGSVITQDWGVRVLAAVSAHDQTYEKRIFPFLKSFLQKCPPKDLLVAVNSGNRDDLLVILETRQSSLKPPQTKRLAEVVRKMQKQ